MKIRHVILIIFALVVAIAAIFGFKLRAQYKSGTLQKKIVDSVVAEVNGNSAESSFLVDLLGINKPKNYLILLLNNTELRPGGGFIGSYAVISVNKGVPTIQKVDGTENLDLTAPTSSLPLPPEPIKKYLSVPFWFFRDSNWSPDFASSSAWGLELYKRENGFLAKNIDGVIGITPTVLEEVLKITGPITVDGKQYSSNNVIERLEYEVEHDYARRGVSASQRKKIIGDLMHILVNKIKSSLLHNWSAYFNLGKRMLAEKQVMMYALDPSVQQLLNAEHWSGEMRTEPGDYVLWADANIGALKTDAAINRQLSYRLTPSSSGYVAEVKMTYAHKGRFDWRTTRYLSFVRVFVPAGSTLIDVNGFATKPQNKITGEIIEGQEGGKQWFGTMVTVDPGKTKNLTFRYNLAPSVVARVAQNAYSLVVQKQPGTLNTPLTLDLNFDKKVLSASPGKIPSEQSDGRYQLITDLSVDRQFKVLFGQ